MQSIDLKLSEIIPYERNPRFNDDAVDAIAKSIAEFGFLNPIVVDANHVIICGHTRFKAAQKLGLVSVPVIVADSLSEDQVKAYRIADNKTSELATWDYGQLVSEIRDLEEQNYDLSNLGFSEDVLNDILSHDEEDFLVMGETAPDALPELDMSCEPISKPGEVYELGDHLLFCGDLNRAKQTSVMFGSGDASLYLARVLNWSESVGETLTFASQHLQGAFYVMSDDKDLMNVRMCCDSCGLTFHESLLWLKSNFRLSEYQYQIQHEPIIYGWKEGCGHNGTATGSSAISWNTITRRPARLRWRCSSISSAIPRRPARSSSTRSRIPARRSSPASRRAGSAVVSSRRREPPTWSGAAGQSSSPASAATGKTSRRSSAKNQNKRFQMILTSEWVSLGHPDKLADFISCFILDRYLERDPETRFALEVQIKDQHVTLGGEVTSKADFSEDEIASFVRTAVELVGYTPSYQKKFGVENTICGGDILVTQHIGKQSPDIAQGVNAGGFGDQGIFFGMAVNSPETDYMPRDWWLARKIGKHLYDIRYAGIDIKTQVSVDAVDLIGNGKVTEVVVAIPMTEKHFDADVSNAVAFCLGGSRSYQLHINGTGRYVKHGPVGDCGTTGRKLAVDFYGGNCRIGGGSPWTKDGTKADLCLNLLARQYAVDRIKATHNEVEYCAISCRIGSPEISVSMRNQNGIETASWTETVYPADLIKRFHLREPRYTQMCRDGLFS